MYGELMYDKGLGPLTGIRRTSSITDAGKTG